MSTVIGGSRACLCGASLPVGAQHECPTTPHTALDDGRAPSLTDPQPTPREVLAKMEAHFAAHPGSASAEQVLTLMRAMIEVGEERDARDATIATLTARAEAAEARAARQGTAHDEATEALVEIAFALGAVHHQKEAPSYAKDNAEILAAAKALRAELERVTGERDASRLAHRTTVTETETTIASLTSERDALRGEVDELTHGINLIQKALVDAGAARGGELFHVSISRLAAETSRLRGAVEEAKRRIYNNQPLAAMRALDAALSPAPGDPPTCERCDLEPVTRELRICHGCEVVPGVVQPLSPAPGEVPTCTWDEDEDGVWTTACGEAWVFNDGGSTPAENNVRFCHSCGKGCAAVPFTPEPDEDEAEPTPSPAEGGGAEDPGLVRGQLAPTRPIPDIDGDEDP